jgi:predicted XRE-type DNA-binding protein
MPIQHDDQDPAHTCPICGDGDHAPRWIDAAVWNRPDMRLALANREIGTVFEILQRHGVSQRKIAARTQQTQSEVSEILNGRKVIGYDVLVRIAKGLGVPRSSMGLAYDTDDGEPPE